MSKALGEKTMQVLQFVASYVALKGYAPTYRQIAAGCGLKSTSNVAFHLDKLVSAGYLAREPGTPRALVVLDAGQPVALKVLKEWEDYGQTDGQAASD